MVKIANRPDGCSLWGECLSCPLPACRFEIEDTHPGLLAKVLAKLRAEQRTSVVRLPVVPAERL